MTSTKENHFKSKLNEKFQGQNVNYVSVQSGGESHNPLWNSGVVLPPPYSSIVFKVCDFPGSKKDSQQYLARCILFFIENTQIIEQCKRTKKNTIVLFEKNQQFNSNGINFKITTLNLQNATMSNSNSDCINNQNHCHRKNCYNDNDDNDNRFLDHNQKMFSVEAVFHKKTPNGIKLQHDQGMITFSQSKSSAVSSAQTFIDNMRQKEKYKITIEKIE